MLRNVGASGHWIGVGAPIGAVVSVFALSPDSTPGPLLGRTTIGGSTGFGAGEPPVARFGTGALTRVDVTIRVGQAESRLPRMPGSTERSRSRVRADRPRRRRGPRCATSRRTPAGIRARAAAFRRTASRRGTARWPPDARPAPVAPVVRASLWRSTRRAVIAANADTAANATTSKRTGSPAGREAKTGTSMARKHRGSEQPRCALTSSMSGSHTVTVHHSPLPPAADGRDHVV